MVSWEPVGFMFFSTLEGVGLTALMLSIFRFKLTKFIWPALSTILIMNLQSYVLRNEFSLSFLVPIINVFLFILFITIVLKQPLIGAAIITLTGYFAFGLLEVSLLHIMFGSISELDSSIINGYILQTTSFVIDTFLAWFLYRHGKGFSFDFEKLRFKRESLLLVVAILLTIIAFIIIMYQLNLNAIGTFFLITLAVYLYYAIKKEREDND